MGKLQNNGEPCKIEGPICVSRTPFYCLFREEINGGKQRDHDEASECVKTRHGT